MRISFTRSIDSQPQ